MCDNTFAGPLLQRPIEHGVDVVLHSASKSLAGHSDVLLGIVVTTDDEFHDRLLRARTLIGSIPGPVEAWLALRGMRTLALRVPRSASQASTGPGIEQMRVRARSSRSWNSSSVVTTMPSSTSE